ncbi:TetR/AcrR family transcriptional regulator [Frankia sp. Ag45/Mut15]|uniref:TetR/AcrR family transcriptional regulator n=1 Tax=Frankia umida TaxID=573489 RepID=A0ABT0JTV5_9ACTN|nr:TetR/AcrR family transcriptional regulator [Frankia umida]MCK9874985.1 TetR/AcrR family transcriptional regulator [Frankia umida]
MARSGAVLHGQLLDAALGLFGQRGFRGTSLQDIAREAGCSKASLLYHFHSKEAIFVELLTPCKDALDDLNDLLRDVPTSDVAHRAVEGFVDVMIRYRRQITLVLQQAAEAAAAQADKEGVISEQRTDLLVHALSGRDPDPSARLRSWMAIGAITLAATSSDTETFTELTRQELITSALRVLRPT